jgi:hypothetical protein
MTIEEFADCYDACAEGCAWAKKNCPTGTMQEAWEKLPWEFMLWVARRPGVLTDRELRLFAVDCARRALGRVKNPDPRSVRAVEVAEAIANGKATVEQLAEARKGAASASYASAAAYVAAHASASSAAYAVAAYTAAVADAACAACASADAAYAADAYSASAYADARQAERDTQCAWLRANTKPNFTKGGAK